MKATSGNMPLDRKYTLISCEYAGKYAADEDWITSIAGQCENCGNAIANIATVKDNTGKEWRIGLDCAATMTGIEPDAIAQAKKKMAQEAKIGKWITEKMQSVILVRDGDDVLWYGFEYDYTPAKMTERLTRLREYSPKAKFNPCFENWKYRGHYAKRQALFEKLARPIYEAI